MISLIFLGKRIKNQSDADNVINGMNKDIVDGFVTRENLFITSELKVPVKSGSLLDSLLRVNKGSQVTSTGAILEYGSDLDYAGDVNEDNGFLDVLDPYARRVADEEIDKV